MNAILSCNELRQRIAAGAVVIDVMTPEEYTIRHLAGAKNAFQMTSLQLNATRPPRSG